MSRDQRRAQLLDVAADLLINKGAQAVTMERLAEWAGVSKALPYSHFENSNDVLVELRNRENKRLAVHVWRVAGTANVGNRVAAVTGAFFDAVEDSIDLLGVLTGPGAIIVGSDEYRQREGVKFVVDLEGRGFEGLDRSSGVEAVVEASRGTLGLTVAYPIATQPGWRVMFDLDIGPDDGSDEPIDLRMYVTHDGKALSET